MTPGSQREHSYSASALSDDSELGSDEGVVWNEAPRDPLIYQFRHIEKFKLVNPQEVAFSESGSPRNFHWLDSYMTNILRWVR